MWSTLPKTHSELTLKIVGEHDISSWVPTYFFLGGKIAITYNQPILSTPTSPTPPKTKKTTNSTTPWLPNSLQVGTQGWPKVYSLGRLLGDGISAKVFEAEAFWLVHERLVSHVVVKNISFEGISWQLADQASEQHIFLFFFLPRLDGYNSY